MDLLKGYAALRLEDTFYLFIFVLEKILAPYWVWHLRKVDSIR